MVLGGSAVSYARGTTVGCRVQGAGCRVQCVGCGVQGAGSDLDADLADDASEDGCVSVC